MTHLYSSCRSACLSATWRFRDALLHSTLPHSWQVNNFFADWVFREFKVSPVIEVSTETQQRTSHAAAHPHNTFKPYTDRRPLRRRKKKKRTAANANLARTLLLVVSCLYPLDYAYVISIASIVRFLLQLENGRRASIYKARIFRDRSERFTVIRSFVVTINIL